MGRIQLSLGICRELIPYSANAISVVVWLYALGNNDKICTCSLKIHPSPQVFLTHG